MASSSSLVKSLKHSGLPICADGIEGALGEGDGVRDLRRLHVFQEFRGERRQVSDC